MMELVEIVFDCANKHCLDAAGVLSYTHRRTGFATTHGGQSITDHTCSRMNVMLFNSEEPKSGWASQSAASPDKIDASSLIEEALHKVAIPKASKSIKPGDYETILDFYACAEIFSILSSNCFSGSAFHEGGKVSAEHLGEALFHPTLNLWDDGCDPSGCPTWCDFEGVAKQRVALIDQGILAGVVYDRETAARVGKQSTGHAQSRRALFASGPQANNLFLQPGQQSIEKMIQSVERGLWITRFQYTTLSDPSELVISGTTRDGTFWIEDGKIQYALPNLKFRVSILKLLKEIQGLSQEVRLLETDYGVIQTPCIKARDFTIL
jgi:predicted Zn-dependent protease